MSHAPMTLIKPAVFWWEDLIRRQSDWGDIILFSRAMYEYLLNYNFITGPLEILSSDTDLPSTIHLRRICTTSGFDYNKIPRNFAMLIHPTYVIVIEGAQSRYLVKDE